MCPSTRSAHLGNIFLHGHFAGSSSEISSGRLSAASVKLQTTVRIGGAHWSQTRRFAASVGSGCNLVMSGSCRIALRLVARLLSWTCKTLMKMSCRGLVSFKCLGRPLSICARSSLTIVMRSSPLSVRELFPSTHLSSFRHDFRDHELRVFSLIAGLVALSKCLNRLLGTSPGPGLSLTCVFPPSSQSSFFCNGLTCSELDAGL